MYQHHLGTLRAAPSCCNVLLALCNHLSHLRLSGREMPDNFARHTRLGSNLKCGLDKLQRADACCIRRLRYRGACTGCDNK